MDFLVDAYEYLKDFNLVSTLLRIFLAALAGGLVGIEREFHGRAAGLRTHMLVSLGAALTALVGLYLTLELGIATDVARISAQVMSGVGFLGAGTILLKKGNSQITGLTTAAGLWATAAIGLAVGFGFYFGAFITATAIVFAFTFGSSLEHLLNLKRQKMFVYLEIDSVDAVQETINTLKTQFSAKEVQVTPARSNTGSYVGVETLIRIPAKVSPEEKLEKLHSLPRVVFVLSID
ncbi:MAG: MgtC/SapB family protein [Clostridia bacterium]|nr:MgtC/SapB family protein [Clostridia bacterium]